MSYWNVQKSRMESRGNTIRDSQINNTINSIINSFFNSPSYYCVEAYSPLDPLSSVSLDAWITDSSKVKDQKNIVVYPNQELTKGYLVYWKNKYWLTVHSDENFGDVYNRGSLLECFTSLKWLDSDGVTTREAYFCIKTDIPSNFGVDNKNIVLLPDERRPITIQANEYTNTIKKGKRFIFDGRAWRVSAIDRIQTGIITLVLDEDQINTATDNVDLRIADYYTSVNDYNIEISNIISEMEMGSTYQILAKLYNHNIEITATPTYTSSDDNILAVDTNGLVSALSIGNADIVLTYKDKIKKIPIESKSATVSNKYVVFDTPAYLYVNQNKLFKVHYEDKGMEFTDISVFSVLDNNGINGTNLVSISSQDMNNNTCELKAKGNIGSFILKVANSDETVVGLLNIEIRSIL